jgi:hypothetical protein
MTGKCHQCRFWGDGINDKHDESRWQTCHGDGRKLFAHRDFSCRTFGRARTLKSEIQSNRGAPSAS